MFRRNVRALGARPLAASSTPAASCRPPVVEPLEGRALMSATLFVSDNIGNLFKLNPTNGAKSAVGRMPVVMYDIAFDKSGKLFGVDIQSNLYRINPGTAGVARIGAVGAFVNGLTFAPDGRLWASGRNTLYTINTSTGRGTAYARFSDTRISSAGDLAFDNAGYVYLTTTADKLVKVSLWSGTYTTVGSIGFNQVYGLAYMNGKLYGLSNASEKAFVINTYTGRGTFTSSFGVGTFGATGAAVRAW